eukprot:3207757-Pyramimonas_sp.AAC.1
MLPKTTLHPDNIFGRLLQMLSSCTEFGAPTGCTSGLATRIVNAQVDRAVGLRASIRPQELAHSPSDRMTSAHKRGLVYSNPAVTVARDSLKQLSTGTLETMHNF